MRTLYPADGLPPDPDVTADLIGALALDKLAAQVGVEAPWSSPRAAEFDSQTLETWAQANLKTEIGRKVFETAVQPNWGAEPRDLSLLYVLFYIAAAGNEKNPGSIIRLISTPGGAQESRVEGGTQLISIRMAKALGKKRVELGVPVKSIRQHNGRVTVEADGLVVHARRAIVAIPPTLTSEIEFHPKLPAKRAQLIQRIPQGTLIKAEAVYDKAFWRAAGLSGQAVADVGPARTTFDASPREALARGDARVRGRARRAVLVGAPRGGTPPGGAQELRGLLRRRGPEAEEVLRAGLDPGGLDAGLPGGVHRPGSPLRVRAGAAAARRERSLGRDRDLDLLDRLHGRRGPLR